MALDHDEAFRRRVARAWRQQQPDLAADLEAGHVPAAVDPVQAALGSYLGRGDDWHGRLTRALATLATDESSAPKQPGPGGEAVGDQSALSEARIRLAAAEAASTELAQEVATMRREQRRLRSDADRSRAAARSAQQELLQERERFARTLTERDEAVRQAQHQAEDARHQVAAARQAAKDGRSLAELRARLLLDTIVHSASGLRRELALPPAAGAPADVVADQLKPGSPAPGIATRGLAADDPALLAEVLRMPLAHLLVDGYNVSIEGYGGLPLIDQRRLLIDGLSALAARTSAEITCCFDGADVDSRAQKLDRGVRVLFSDPGMTADELIRRLVSAEPEGRVLVVVSSDAEVAQRATAAGARAVPSSALLRLLGAGQRDRRR
jgi:predicted RNA-binding protein with PIN domain